MVNETNVLDKSLDSAFEEEELDNTIDINDKEIDNSNETDTTSENEETLETLMQEFQSKTEKKDNKTNNNINNSEQITEQQSNKSKGNNNSKDLIDANGNVIAKAGAERRFYEENIRLKKEKEHFNTRVLPTIKQNYEAMRTKIASYEEAFKAMRADDLDASEISTGIALIRNWKKSPEETIKYLLTQAKSYGINIDNVTNSGVDMAAINQMLDEKLQPFVQERENAYREQQIKQQSRQIYNNFMYKFPDAAKHKKEIAYIMNKNPNMSLDAIYYQLKNHYLENGYDFNVPLEEIINKNNQKTNNVKNFNSPNTNQTINTQQIKTNIASINKSYEDIIKESMKNYKRK